MFWRNSPSSIFDRYLYLLGTYTKRNEDGSTRRCEAKCVLDQITHGAPKQHRISPNVSFSSARDSDLAFFGDQFIKLGDFFDSLLTIEHRPLDMLLSRVSSR